MTAIRILKFLRQPQVWVACLLLLAVGTAAYYFEGQLNYVPSGATFTCDYYAAPNGVSSNTGTSASPWDLQSALNKTSVIVAGKTLCLKGGTYNNKFTSNLNGGTVRSAPGEWAKIDGYVYTTLTAPITASSGEVPVADTSKFSGTELVEISVDNEVIRVYGKTATSLIVYDRGASGSVGGAAAHAAGAKVTLSGRNLFALGSNTTFRDFEVFNGDPTRNASVNPVQAGGRGDGVVSAAPGHKFINLIIHDTVSGIMTSAASSNTEIYGNLIYNVGSNENETSGLGHGMYLENGSGTQKVYNNIVYNAFNLGMQAYGVTAPYLGGDLQDNVFANSGAPMSNTPGNRNAVIGPESQRIPSINIERNHFVHRQNTAAYGVIIGYGAGVSSGTFNNNYVVGGTELKLAIENSTNISGQGNHIYGADGGGVDYLRIVGPTGFSWNNNSYHKVDERGEFVLNSEVYGFTAWKAASGFDSNSSATSAAMPNRVIVAPNTYEQGRANVYIYNTAGGTTATINLSLTGLTNGQAYEIRNPQNYYGPVVASGTYDSSNPIITVSLSGAAASVATPIGRTYTAPTTCPEFCPLMVIPTSVTTNPTPAPTIASFTANPATITAGGSSTLSWEVSGATSLSINQNIGTVTGTSRSVSPTATTTYTLTATNSAGSATRAVTVTVNATQPPVGQLPSGALARYAGNPLVPMGASGSIDDDKTGPRAVLKESATSYKMWYEAVPAPNASTVGYATSADGKTWTKQGSVLSPSAPWEGGANGEISPNTVINDNGTYKMWYHSFNPADGKRRIGYATSTNGTTWTKRANPVLDVGAADSDDDYMVVEPRVFKMDDGTYRMYYGGMRSTQRDQYRMMMATSPDGITWTKTNQSLFGPSEGAGFAIVRDGSMWHVWYDNDYNSLNYASSTDGITWTDGPSNPVLTLNPTASAPDSGGVGDSVAAYKDGNEFRVMYTGGRYNSFGRSEAICMATITVGTAPAPVPTISSFTASPSTISSGNASTLSWSVTGATSLSINQGIGTVTGTSRSVAPTVTTTYILTATNSAGSATRNVTVTVTANAPDTTPPTASITAPVNGGTVSATTTVTATASDNIGVAGVQFYLDGETLFTEDTTAPYSVNWNTTSATNGAHTLTAVARDAAGNTGTSSVVTVMVNNSVIDTVRPSINFTSPGSGTTASGTITLSVNATDNIGVAGVQFKIDGQNIGAEDITAPYTMSWNTTSKANGGYTLSAVARDAAGNTNSASIKLTINNTTSDTTAPTVTITAPINNARVSNTINLTANASDNVGVAGVQFKVNGANVGAEDTTAPYATTWNTTVVNHGNYAITAVARDAAGNTTTSTAVSVVVDNAVAESVANGSNIKCGTNSTIYYYYNGKKEAYPNSTVYEIWNGKNYSSIITVSAEFCAATPDNGFVRLPSGTLVKAPNSSTIYMVENNTLRPFSSYRLYLKYKGSKKLYTLSTSYLATFPIGPAITQ